LVGYLFLDFAYDFLKSFFVKVAAKCDEPPYQGAFAVYGRLRFSWMTKPQQ